MLAEGCSVAPWTFWVMVGLDALVVATWFWHNRAEYAAREDQIKFEYRVRVTEGRLNPFLYHAECRHGIFSRWKSCGHKAASLEVATGICRAHMLGKRPFKPDTIYLGRNP
jgi:hypothetical protein